MDNQRIYNNRFADKKALEDKNKTWRILCKYFFQEYIHKDSLIIDIAAGYCEFINNIESKEKIAFDLNPDLKQFANEDVLAVNSSFFEVKNYLQGKKADVIFESNVLEHLDSKEQVIQSIEFRSDNLKNGGRLLILQPNIKYVQGAYWDFIDHKVALTEKALIEVATMCNLKLKVNYPKFLPYTTKSKIPQYPWLVWLYLKLMPISGFFLGQQSFLVFEKFDE